MSASFAFDEAGSPAAYILAYETIRHPVEGEPGFVDSLVTQLIAFRKIHSR
jgi:hypothetical protein